MKQCVGICFVTLLLFFHTFSMYEPIFHSKQAVLDDELHELITCFNQKQLSDTTHDDVKKRYSQQAYENLKYYYEQQLHILHGSLEELDMLGNPFLMYPLLFNRANQRKNIMNKIEKYSFFLDFLNGIACTIK